MKLSEILKNKTNKEIWDYYCHFLNIDLGEYMDIQFNLLSEQIVNWDSSKMSLELLGEHESIDLNNYRKVVPLTEYEDYAKYLLDKKTEYLSESPEIWIQTTWEGGIKPIKLAPYTKKMLDVFFENIVCAFLMSTAKKKNQVKIDGYEKVLYGLAPLPFLTGVFPYLVEKNSDIAFLPPVNEAINLSFKERNKLGFKLALKNNVDYFFGLGSVCYAVSSFFDKALFDNSKKSSNLNLKPGVLFKVIKAKIKKKVFKKEILPKDLFKLKGFIVAGTDNEYYKDDLKKMWGIRPLELFAGTEVSFIGIESFSRNGMYFFPNVGFYEFIKLKDTIKSKIDCEYVPKTYLMNEVEEGEIYELVISNFHNGAFMRYRVGDVYKCIGKVDEKEKIRIPRFKYIDRIPWIIDIAGFTRFNEEEIVKVLNDCNIQYSEFVALKDFNENNKPFLHLFIEGADNSFDIESKICESFKRIDEDFEGLQKILGFNPLKITLLADNRLSKYIKEYEYFMHVDSMNKELLELLKR